MADQHGFKYASVKITAAMSIVPFYCDFKDLNKSKTAVMQTCIIHPDSPPLQPSLARTMHENEAPACYQDTLKSRGENVEVTKCGFVMDSEKGYFGATPDATVTLANGNQGIVKVKCQPLYKKV